MEEEVHNCHPSEYLGSSNNNLQAPLKKIMFLEKNVLSLCASLIKT